MDRDINPITAPSEILIDGVVQHLSDTVMQSAFVGPADIHPRLFPNRLEPLQLPQLFDAISARGFGHFIRIFSRFQYVFLRHKSRLDSRFWPSRFRIEILENWVL